MQPWLIMQKESLVMFDSSSRDSSQDSDKDTPSSSSSSIMVSLSRYTCPQRVGFVGIALGFCLCLVGVVSPYWVTGKSTDPLDKANTTDLHAGLFWRCVLNNQDERDCDANGIFADSDDRNDEMVIVDCLAVGTIALSLLALTFALCPSKCCARGTTVCHGVMTFIAGGAGIAVGVVVQMSSATVFYGDAKPDPWTDFDFHWSFYSFVAGSGLLTLVSFWLCTAPVAGSGPDETTPLTNGATNGTTTP